MSPSAFVLCVDFAARTAQLVTQISENRMQQGMQRRRVQPRQPDRQGHHYDASQRQNQRRCASGNKSDVAVYRKNPDARAKKTASHFGEGKNASASIAPPTGAIASSAKKM